MSEEIDEINKTLQEHEKRIIKLEKLLLAKPEAPKKRLSIKEFILQKHPTNDLEKALAIGYYLEKYENLASFNAKDVEKGFRASREVVPTNVADKIQKNIAKSYMMEEEEERDGLKAYALTNSGERIVENDFKEK